jgi:hypothetical protein
VPVSDGPFAMASNNQRHVGGGSADGNFGSGSTSPNEPIT